MSASRAAMAYEYATAGATVVRAASGHDGQRRQPHPARAPHEPLDDLLVERNAVGAPVLELLGLRQAGVEHALLPGGGRAGAQGPQHVVHRALEAVEVGEGPDVVGRELVLGAARRVEHG